MGNVSRCKEAVIVEHFHKIDMDALYLDLQAQSVSSLYRIVDRCRTCHAKDLLVYLDLGFHPPSDQFRRLEELDLPEVTYPLRVQLCQNCGLSQLTHVVDPRVLYQFDYPYESSTTKTGKQHWDDFASSVVSRLSLPVGSRVVDVGSNVGTLLESFRDQKMHVYGIDPAPNIVEIANKNGVETMCAFFSRESAAAAFEQIGKVDVITGTNVFAHVDDLDDVLQSAFGELLNEQGVFIFESPHISHLITRLEYDTIYHEHLSYLSLKPVKYLVERHGLEIFAVEETEIHGGSFRVYIGRRGMRPIDPSVGVLEARELSEGVHSLEVLKRFADRVAENRERLVWLIEELRHQGKRVAIVSTPAKGMTLLNYCGFTRRQMVFATEKSMLKIGRVTPGGHILIVPDSALLENMPDYALLLAWNFSKEIMANLHEYSKKGGRFIIPVPEPTIA